MPYHGEFADYSMSDRRGTNIATITMSITNLFYELQHNVHINSNSVSTIATMKRYLRYEKGGLFQVLYGLQIKTRIKIKL